MRIPTVSVRPCFGAGAIGKREGKEWRDFAREREELPIFGAGIAKCRGTV